MKKKPQSKTSPPAAKKAVAKSATSKRSSVKRKKTETIKAVMKTQNLDFPIVGIGASAGGLEAVSALLKRLPEDIGMAFVLVQHLAPEHQSMLAELLARETPLAVSEITDDLQVKPNHVYVIPPNANLGIINKTLHLMPRDKNKQHLPIDYFFRSLAADRGCDAIGVILSGSASDGTLGLKAIKSEDGITFAQAPETAHYDSMPTSAIAAGCVDFVLSPEGIAQQLIHIARHPDVMRADIAAGKGEEAQINSELQKIFMLLRNRTGNDFTHYKHTTIRRRISRRMMVNKIDRLKDYVRYLDSHPPEVDALFQDVLINVTSFFRDTEVFAALKNSVFPMMIRDHDNRHPIRIWVPGCSTGEEVYSIIITLLESLGENVAGTMVQVFASDIDAQSIDKARAGTYPVGITADVSPERLRRFFSKVPQGYQINKRIRDLCVFAIQNITKDPPFSHLDLIACRNMLIYMGGVLQRNVLQTIHYALNPGGYLLLGSSETIGASADLFSLDGKEHKIYRKKDVPGNVRYHPSTLVSTIIKPTLFKGKPSVAEQLPMNLQQLAESIILNQYSPPGVVINERLDVIQFIGQMGPYIGPAPGSASLNLIKLAHPDLSSELRIATHNAIQHKVTTAKEGVRLRHNGKIEEVTLEVIPLPVRDATEQYYLVIFRKVADFDATTSTAAKGKSAKQAVSAKQAARTHELEQELETTKAYMQAIIEDQETSNEELQAANEEIQSTNEELQSTNEELETAKEELQSTNEELVTVNEELENRNAELSTSNDDLRNIIASTDLPVVMLNEDLNIRFFSPQARHMLNLIDSDIGRPIGDIRPKVNSGDISGEILNVIKTLKPLVMEVHDDQGRWYSMNIRPYLTEDSRIKGAVMVFIDITDSKMLQRAGRLATVVENSNDAITVQGFDGQIIAWNPKAEEIYGYTEEEALNANIDIMVPDENQQELQAALDNVRQGRIVMPFETERKNKKGERFKVLMVISILNDEQGKPTAIATTEHLLAD
jgi:two-component system CheB/CheR fusion protein